MHFGRLASLVIVILSVLVLPSFSHQAQAAGQTLSVDGREFDFFSPPGMERVQAPLVIVLHGGLSSAVEFRGRFSLVEQAAVSGYHVAYLNGTIQGRERSNRRTWNAGACCGSAFEQGVNDVAFIADVISALTGSGLADPRRVFLVGSSNGAMMAYRFACERRDMVKGVVALAGVLVMPSCANASGVEVLAIHGMRDDKVPVGGGGNLGNRLIGGDGFRSLNDTVSALQAGGASVDVILLDSAEHRAETIDAAMRSERGTTLAVVITQFMQNS